MLFYKAIAEPLRSNNEIFDPLRMQAFDSRIIALLPILMLAPLAHTSHRAVQSGLPIEFPGFQFQIGIFLL